MYIFINVFYGCICVVYLLFAVIQFLGQSSKIQRPSNRVIITKIVMPKRKAGEVNSEESFMANKLKIGIFGGGIVGGGVYELISRGIASGKFASLGASLDVTKICVRSLDKPRDFELKGNCKLVTNYSDILNDPEINCVVELMGGITSAKEVVMGAIAANKHVVTANKALIAAYLPEIQAALKAHPTVTFNYEAAVCGGIPIIHTLQSDFFADTINKVMGIMNGTTNFMLCKMEDEGAEYADALKEAQALGFAEADPTADVEGHDVQAKISLLAKLCFGVSVPWETVPTVGISKLGAVDFEYASILKSTIKLVGTASLNSDKSLAVYVSPVLVPLSSPLASAKGPGNMVVVSSENMGGNSTFAGPGAGRYPTANSVLNDLIRISLNKTVDPFPLNVSLPLNNDYVASFYVRISCADGLGIVRAVGEAAEHSGVSIHAILQNPITSRAAVDFVVTTEDVRLSQVQDFANRIAAMPFSRSAPLFMPILQK